MKQYGQNVLLRIVFLVAIGLLIVPSASAHLGGQPPYFKINDVYSEIYPVQAGKNTTAFTFPQDVGATSYLVNKPIAFSLNTATLPYPTDSLSQLIFSWDLGDGTKATGLTANHSYKKSGTYEVVVTTKAPDSDQEFLLQDTYVHIVPSKDTALPKPILRINGKKAKDYPLEFAQADLTKPIELSVELPKNTQIVSYTWDLDDGTTMSGPTLTHTFSSDRSVVGPILRIVDKNGIITDVTEPIVNKKLKETFQPILLISASVFILIVVLIALVILRRRRRRK